MKSFDLRPGEIGLLRRALRYYAKDQQAGFAAEIAKGMKGDSRRMKEYVDAVKACDRLDDRLLKDPAPDRHAMLVGLYAANAVRAHLGRQLMEFMEEVSLKREHSELLALVIEHCAINEALAKYIDDHNRRVQEGR